MLSLLDDSPPVCIVQQLKRAGIFSESILLNNLFVTVHDAVLHTRERQAQKNVSQVGTPLLKGPSSVFLIHS